MNLTQEPFTDKKVREAFAYAIDRETLCAEIRSGNCVADALLDPAGSPRLHRNRQVRLRSGRGQAGAGRILLRRTGETARDQALPSTATFPARSEAVGVDRRTDSRHSRHRAQDRADRWHDLDRPAQGCRRPTRSSSISAAGSRTTPTRRTGSASTGPAIPRSLNRVGYCNEEFDALTKKGDTTVDPEERINVLRAGRSDSGRRRARSVPLQPHRHLRRQPERHRLHPDGERGRSGPGSSPR